MADPGESASRKRCSSGGRLPLKASNTASVLVIATWCATRSAIISRMGCPPISSFPISPRVTPCEGHTSGCLPAWNSVSTSSPCSRLSMPIAAASRKPIEQRWPVTLMPCRCAASTAAFSSARVIFMYALKEVTPSAAQYSTVRTASSGPVSSCICGPAILPVPSRYGPVMNRRGPGMRPASISRFMFRSVYGSRLPAVRAVVTPAARYRRGKLKACSV